MQTGESRNLHHLFIAGVVMFLTAAQVEAHWDSMDGPVVVEAKAAIRDGRIRDLIVVPENYVESGELLHYTREWALFSGATLGESVRGRLAKAILHRRRKGKQGSRSAALLGPGEGPSARKAARAGGGGDAANGRVAGHGRRVPADFSGRHPAAR